MGLIVRQVATFLFFSRGGGLVEGAPATFDEPSHVCGFTPIYRGVARLRAFCLDKLSGHFTGPEGPQVAFPDTTQWHLILTPSFRTGY